MQTQHELTMSFYNEFGDLNVYAKQNDTRRFIQFEFTEDVIPEDTSDFVAFIRGKYPDGSLLPITCINKVLSVDGYYYNERFYSDLAHTTEIVGQEGLIYKDILTVKYYRWKRDEVQPEPTPTPTPEPTPEPDPNSDPEPSSDPEPNQSSNSTTVTVTGSYYEISNPTDGNVVTRDYILFRIPSELLEVPGKVTCDLVLFDGTVMPIINPDGTVDNQSQILSTHTFYIYVEATASNGASVSSHEQDLASTLTTLIISASDIVAQGKGSEDAEKKRNVNEYGGSATLSDGTTYEVPVNEARVGAENIRKANETARNTAEETRQQNEQTRIHNEEVREDAELGLIAEAKSYAIGDEASRAGSSVDNAKYYYEQTKQAVYGKGIMEMNIDENGHLLYTRSDDLSAARFEITDNKKLTFLMDSSLLVTPPTVTADLTYTGGIQRPTISSFDQGTIVVTGMTQAVDAGTYELYCTPGAGCKWIDGTTDTLTYTWTINKANRAITLSKNNILLTTSSPTDTITLTYVGEGNTTISGIDESVATATINDKVITITKVSTSIAQTSFTVTVAADTNYNSITSESISVSTNLRIVSFSNGTDKEISDMLNAYYNNEITLTQMGWQVGDTRLIHLNEMDAPTPQTTGSKWLAQDITVEIVATEHTDLSESINGHNKACVTVQTREMLSGTLDFDQKGRIYINGDSERDLTFTKWSNLYMRNYLNTTVLGAMPSGNFKSAIKQSKHYRHTDYNTADDELVIDTLFLPSYPEVFGTDYWEYIPTTHTEGTQFERYTTQINRMKQYNNNGQPSETGDNWWNGSATSRYSSSAGYSWCTVSNNGGTNIAAGNESYGLAPAWAM